MLVDVLGTGRSVTDDVREKTVSKVERLGKLVPLLEEAEVRLTRGGDGVAENHWSCHAVLRGHGHEVRGYAEGTDAIFAVDAVVKKLEHQVERLKGKLIGRSHPRHEGST